MNKVAFYTLGCKVNQYETEAITELFISNGYKIVSFDSIADIYIINTCTVTNMSDRKSRQIIRRAKKYNPDAIVVVTGCYAQTAPDKVAEIDDVNLIIGTKDRKNIVSIVESITTKSKVLKVDNIMDNHTFEELTINSYTDRTRAYIKIQEGCNQFCSYCIIPYARGPIRSRPLEDILCEVKKLADNNFKEIIFVGIHVASYGADLGNTSLSELLIKSNKIQNIQRIRLSSIEPMTLNEDFIESIKGCDKLCHHFHISLQSGCDTTLTRMNRKYTTSQYKSIVDLLRKHFKDVAITTDIMVGFPGETDDEFNQTVEFVKNIGFSDAHIFQYSQRDGTPAALYTNQIDPSIKEERSKIIANTINQSRNLFLNSFIGKTMTVLFEKSSHSQINWFEGKTGNYITILAKSDKDLCGTFANVVLEKIADGSIIGTII